MKPRTYNAFWETSWIAIQKMFQHKQLFTPATTKAVYAIAENTDASTFDIPEERKADFFQDTIDLYESVLTPEALKKQLEYRIDYYKGDNSLAENFDIGDKENCDYLDEESFFNDANYELAIVVLKTIWAKACLTDEELEKEKANHTLYELLFPSIEEHD